jgi:preprotein translocase subunit SecF
MNFLKYTKLYFAIAIISVGLSIYSLFAFGLNLGIDFEGGSSLNVVYTNNAPSTEQVKTYLSGVEEMRMLRFSRLVIMKLSLG